MVRTEEQLFRRFSRAGDVEALGEVFDRLAPRLLALGVRLVREPDAAEDLVQATFVTAIERAGSYDDARPLLPWLCGILTRHARNLQRKAAARPAQALSVETGEEPSDALERSEFLDELDRSIEELPSDLRPLLVLRLRHDLSPAEIAHALGRPPSTVRTQLQRGLEKLREKLPSAYAASSLFALSPTRGLPSIRAEVMSAGAAKVTLATSGILTVIAMKKILTVAAAIVLVSLGFWVSSDSRAEDIAASPVRPSVLEGSSVPLAAARGDDASSSPAALEREAVASPVPEEVPVAGEVALPASSPAREDFTLEVVDPLGRPVSKARVKLIGMHPAESPGSSYGWMGPDCEGTTDNEGHVALWFPARMGRDLTLEKVAFRIVHPEFVTLELWHFDPREDDRRIALEVGAFVAVSGYIGARSNIVTQVEIHVTDDANLTADAWAKMSDGRLSTQRIPLGKHVLYLEHTSVGGRRYFSAFETFELSEGEQKDLHLELVPGRSLLGELDPQVPRPTLGGKVSLSLGHGDGYGTPVLGRGYKAEIAEDGTFRFDDLPPGSGEIIALCEGWVTEPVPPAPPGTIDAERSEPDGSPPTVDPSEVEGVFVLPMVPTANLTVTVVDAAGKPVEGAVINMWPNIRWKNGYSQIFLGGSWHGMSDEYGRIVVRDLPVGDVGPYEMTHLTYRWDDAETPDALYVVSGENELEVTMIKD